MVDCRIYLRTGLNATNLPEGPSYLNNYAYFVDVPALDIMQECFLSKIKVKAYFNQIKDGDYLRLDGDTGGAISKWYYTIDNIRMVAEDVAELAITPDYLTSIGGVDNLVITDGITDRVCVGYPGNDEYGQWDPYDPLLTPSAPLKVFGQWSSNFGTGTTTFIETTLDPVATGFKGEGVLYEVEDPANPGTKFSRVVPEACPNPAPTIFTATGYSESHATTLYKHETTAAHVEEGIARLRGLGLEQSIISQYELPNNMASVGYGSALIPNPHSHATIRYNYVSGVNGVDTTFAPAYASLAFGWHNLADYEVKNNLILYSGYTKYGIVTCSGARAEFIPSDLYRGDESMDAKPLIRLISDPHPDGRPYYRFEYAQGTDFWINCLPGARWKQVPLVYQGASGSTINTLRFDANRQIQANAFQRGDFNAYHQLKRTNNDTTLGALGGALESMIGAVSGNAMMVGEGLGKVGNIFHGAGDAYQIEGDWGYNEKDYKLRAESELLDLQLANTVVAPEMNIPFDGDLLRDATGNACYIYRYHYDYRDIKRIDKLLTMYGYKITKPLEKTDFTNREFFNFVKCSSVTVTGNSKWVNDGVAAQLRNGVRIWHGPVNPGVYNDGNFYPD